MILRLACIWLVLFIAILCELTIYTNTHEQQPYCLGTLSQMTERSAERRVRQETVWLAGGPLLRVPTIRRITDTFLFISHTTNVLLFKSRCNIFIGVRIIKELPDLVGSGATCIITYISTNSNDFMFLCFNSFVLPTRHHTPAENDIQMKTKFFPILIIYDICNFAFFKFYTGYRYYRIE
jgi:hypothetical protein